MIAPDQCYRTREKENGEYLYVTVTEVNGDLVYFIYEGVPFQTYIFGKDTFASDFELV